MTAADMAGINDQETDARSGAEELDRLKAVSRIGKLNGFHRPRSQQSCEQNFNYSE